MHIELRLRIGEKSLTDDGVEEWIVPIKQATSRTATNVTDVETLLEYAKLMLRDMTQTVLEKEKPE